MAQSMWHNIPVEIVDQAVVQTFQMLIEADASPAQEEDASAANDISMAVFCDESQQSAVLVRCSRELALIVTSRMFESAQEDLQDKDVQDATGELVNVIAGSLRGMMDNPGAMSTPFCLSTAEVDAMRSLDKRHYRIEEHYLSVLRV